MMNDTKANSWSLFFDIDGTLVSFQSHRIPNSTISALREAKRRGARIYISTGRPIQIITNLGDIAELIDGYITVNGAYCVVGEREVSCHPISREDVRTLAQDALANDYSCMVVGEKDFAILNHHDIVDEVFIEELAVEGINFRIDALEVLQSQRILQLSPFFEESYETGFMPRIPHCVSGRWHPSFTDITDKDADKGRGLQAMIAAEGLDPAHTMAFGDGGNDISILQRATVGVAMGNASPRVQQEADYVTSSVDEDGVRNALLHFGII